MSKKPTSPATKPEYFKLSQDSLDSNTQSKDPDKDRKRQQADKASGSGSKKGPYLALESNAVDPSGRHTRSHSTGNPPTSNYSMMSSGAMVDADGKVKKKDYFDLDSKDFNHRLHPSPGGASTGGHGGTTPLRSRNNSLSAGGSDDVFDTPVMRPNFTHNYAPTISSQDFPDGSGPPIQRLVGGLLSGGSGGVDSHTPSTTTLSRSESSDSVSYSNVNGLEAGRWTAAEGKLDLDVEHKAYYRPDCGRSGAQKALESKPAGTFLFRLCSDRQENDMHGHVFVLNYINATDKKFSNVKIYRFPDGSVGGSGPQKGWCMHRDRSKGTVYPNLDIIIRAINFGVTPTPLS